MGLLIPSEEQKALQVFVRLMLKIGEVRQRGSMICMTLPQGQKVNPSHMYGGASKIYRCLVHVCQPVLSFIQG